MPGFITIHGHFYQPPRENPWLEAVETQDSAFPYHDWNERITIECYEPNASARILDAKDRIRRIANNYESISFNFGATLLSWLATSAPETYAAILAADRVSRQRFSGHGCAMAQAYNHIILPLATARDQRTQVRWGMRDFEHRFGRKAEGMWLPETAVDVASLESLAAEGVAFTILEPHQAMHWRPIGEKAWRNGNLDPTLSYVCNLPSGASINIFFYDGPISRAVAFEQLLARGENLALRLVAAFDGSRTHDQLVNIATDGETYGHHHRFGEMALAYALQFIEEQHLAKLTNYGEHLARYPPAHEVEIVERTSWSCSHGVERWRSDCGCNAGGGAGWNQQWRTPLREALEWLRDRVLEVFESVGSRVLRDPWEARDEYVDIILDRSEECVEQFTRKHGVDGADATTILELLEMQRYAMLMFTSCGWFFSDVSGIETVQVLHYAGRVIQLAERASGTSLEREFIDRLSTSRSNIADRGSARDLYEREVIPARLDLGRVAAHYAVLSLFDTFDDDAAIYCYDVHRRDFEIHKSGRARLAIGSIEVRSRITRETAAFDLTVLHLGETELTGGVRVARSREEFERVRQELAEAMEPGGMPAIIRLMDQQFGETPISIRSLFRDEQRRIIRELLNATLEEAESTFRQLHEHYVPLMRFHARLGIPVPKLLQTAAEFDLNIQIRHMVAEQMPPLPEIAARLREARDENVTLDETTLIAIQLAAERAADRFLERAEDLDRLEVLETLVAIIREANLAVDLRRVQNRYYHMRNFVRPAIRGSAATSAASRDWLEIFDALGAMLSVAQEELVPSA